MAGFGLSHHSHGDTSRTLPDSAVLHAIRHLKPRLLGPGVVANPRDTYGYRCGLRLAKTQNPSVLNVPSSMQHCTSRWSWGDGLFLTDT
jgi:hypothetical protein